MEHNQSPYYIEFCKSETDRNLKHHQHQLHQLHQQQQQQQHQQPVMTTSQQHPSSKSAREKINRSQSQMTYRSSNGATGNGGQQPCFEVSKVYASKLMYERPDDFACYSEAATLSSRSNRTNERRAAMMSAEKSPIKKSKSSHIIKSSYSPKSFMDSTIGIAIKNKPTIVNPDLILSLVRIDKICHIHPQQNN
jgi:hypothetical protein